MSIETITPENITPDIKSAVRALLLAKTFAQVEREMIDAMQRDILMDGDRPLYRVIQKKQDQGRPEWITDPKYAYSMSKDDYLSYSAECDHRIKQMGYDVPEGYCPALIAESLQRKAEKILIDSAKGLIGFSFDDLIYTKPGIYDKYVNLLCSLVISLPDWKNPLD